MRSRTRLYYPAAGALTGALAGLLLAAGLLKPLPRPLEFPLLIIAGALAASAGSLAAHSRARLVPALLAGAFLPAALSFAFYPVLTSDSALYSRPLLLNASLAAFATLVAGAYSYRSGPRVAFASAVFAAIAALLAIALSASFITHARPLSTLIPAGALFGLALWSAVAIAENLFAVHPEDFRV